MTTTPNLRSNRYCFTENTMQEPRWDPLHMKYLVYQTEVAPATGHNHIQGYVRFNERVRVQKAKQLLAIPGAHFEMCKGTEEQNRKYCTKEDSRAPGPAGEYGTYDSKEGQGKRTDLQSFQAAALSGALTLHQVAVNHGSLLIKYPTGVKTFLAAAQAPPPAIRPMKVIWMWGPTSQGKTYRAFQQHPNLYTVTLPHPWDSYEGQQVILLDEFAAENWEITSLNRVLDQYRYELACRYQNKMARWNLVIICSNADPMTFYTESHVDQRLLNAFRRRINEVYYVEDRESLVDLSLPPGCDQPIAQVTDQAPGINTVDEADIPTAPSSPQSPDLFNL